MRRLGPGLPDRRIRRQTRYFIPHKGLRRGLNATAKIFPTAGRFSPPPNVEVIQKRTSEYSPRAAITFTDFKEKEDGKRFRAQRTEHARRRQGKSLLQQAFRLEVGGHGGRNGVHPH